jgi:hypothetical protein
VKRASLEFAEADSVAGEPVQDGDQKVARPDDEL